MKLPILIGTYSSDEDVSNIVFLGKFKKFIEKDIEKNKQFFVGLCNSCYSPGSSKHPLSPCVGCELVRYCSKGCQKDAWGMHQYVCKEFPAVKQKSVLQTIPGPWKEKISILRKRAAQVPHAVFSARSIFHNPRVCRLCHDARPSNIFDCKCLCVSYCSSSCMMRDYKHQKDCSSLQVIAQASQLTYDHDLKSMRDMSVCSKFTPMSKFDDIYPDDYQYTIMKEIYIRDKGDAMAKYSSLNERLSYPLSLLYALTILPGRLLGRNYWALEDLTSLVVHVVTSSPQFDSEPWEEFMHRLPRLKQLNIVFIMQGQAFKLSFYNNIRLTLQRCRDCQSRNRIINYSVHQMKYHMFFSSEAYTEPDVVVVFGNTHEMPASLEEDLHSEISYGNMISGSHTILVLSDETKHRVVQGVSAVQFSSHVETLVPPQINPLRGFSSNRNDIDFDESIFNDRHYIACLRKLDEKRQGKINSYQFKLLKHRLKEWLTEKMNNCIDSVKTSMRGSLGRTKDYLLSYLDFDKRWLVVFGVILLLICFDNGTITCCIIVFYILKYFWMCYNRTETTIHVVRITYR